MEKYVSLGILVVGLWVWALAPFIGLLIVIIGLVLMICNGNVQEKKDRILEQELRAMRKRSKRYRKIRLF